MAGKYLSPFFSFFFSRIFRMSVRSFAPPRVNFSSKRKNFNGEKKFKKSLIVLKSLDFCILSWAFIHSVLFLSCKEFIKCLEGLIAQHAAQADTSTDNPSTSCITTAPPISLAVTGTPLEDRKFFNSSILKGNMILVAI